MRLPVAADQAGSKHLGDSRNRGKAGLSVDPARGSDGRRPRDARLWRGAGAWPCAGVETRIRVSAGMRGRDVVAAWVRKGRARRERQRRRSGRFAP